MRIILASGSPRRKELLAEIFGDFEISAALVDERAIEKTIENELSGMDMRYIAEETVKRLSAAKAVAVYKKIGCPKDTLVIGADTAVSVSDEIMGKPKDRDDAVRMLRKLSTEKQYVLTGVTFVYDNKIHTFAEVSAVVFNKLDAEQERKIQVYCDTSEPYDKAGAYGIQVIGDEMVDHIEGDFKNIMGFPVDRIKKELADWVV